MTFDEVHKLIKKGDLLSLRQALGDGVDPNQPNRFGWTLLMIAARKGTHLPANC
jgi:ankyrin repeat protein